MTEDTIWTNFLYETFKSVRRLERRAVVGRQ